MSADNDELKMRQGRLAAFADTNLRTLGEALPAEMARVRDEVMPAYLSIGPAGAFALAGMRADLDAAAKALAEGDVVAMLRIYGSLKEWNT